MEERVVNKVSSTIDKKLTWFFEKEKNFQEANRLVNAAIAIDPSLRVTRDENVVAEAAVVEESTNNLPIPFVLPYIWKDERFQDTLFFEMAKIWHDQVIPRIAKYGKRHWYISASNSSNLTQIKTQRNRRSDFSKHYRKLLSAVGDNNPTPERIFTAAQALDSAWNTAREKFSHLFSKNCGKFSDLQQFKGKYSDILSFSNFIITRRQDKKNKEVSL